MVMGGSLKLLAEAKIKGVPYVRSNAAYGNKAIPRLFPTFFVTTTQLTRDSGQEL
jgi:hypothetical protein